MRAADSSSKALVFSQFTSTIDWLKGRLTEHGFGYRTISGSMPLPQRAKAIDAFQKDPPTTVFLLSVRSGAVGINLTAASHVFLLEPLLNPALEAQAIGRSWRMGQTREVTVHKMFVAGTVEERILELVKQRAAGPAQGEAGEAASKSALKGKAKAAAIAGAIQSDRQQLRMGELELLFKGF